MTSSVHMQEFRNRRNTKLLATEKKQKEAAERARKRAEQGEPIFYEGKEAIGEVARKEGIWNWVLLGPDPEEIPLVSGGGGGIEEMNEAMGQHAQSVALIRAAFGVGEEATTKFIIVQVKASGRFTMQERGQATTGAPQVQKEIEKSVPQGSLKIEMGSQEECTVANFVAKLLEVSADDAEKMTEEGYRVALEEHKKANPFLQKQEEKQEQVKELLVAVQAPPSAAVAPEPEAQPAEAEETEPSKLRDKVKTFQKGEMVEVFSSKTNQWMVDAEVVQVVQEACVIDNFNVKAGSMKVVYNNGARFKWVAPSQIDNIRASNRPRPPDSHMGMMQKETHNWITQWHERYFELQRGFLQWWMTEKDAKGAVAPNGSLYLLGLQLKIDGSNLKMRSDNSNQVIYTFRVEDEEQSKAWVDALWAHAGYCGDVKDFFQVKQDGSQMRKELLTMMATRKSHK